MTTQQMDQILDKALNDDEFLERLHTSPRETVAEVGAELTDTEVDTVKGMSKDELRAFAAEYKAETDPDKRRAAC